MMTAAGRRGKIQSVNGLLRSLGAAPGALRARRPIYRHLLGVLEDGIARGVMPVGFRLPAERELARAAGVSRTTVVSAYRELEARGLVRAYVGRGTFVSAAPDPGRAPFAWQGKVAASALSFADATVRDLMRASIDPRVLSFAAGRPALDLFPTHPAREALDRILTANPQGAWGNGPTEGHLRFRSAISDRFGGAHDQILAVTGAQQGLDLLARCLIDPGDPVIIDRPAYMGAIHSFRSAGARLIGWDVRRADLDELEECFNRRRPKFLYLNPTYQNPTGGTLPLRVRRELLEIAARHRVPVIEDDTYRELSLGAPPPPSMFQLDERREIVIHLNTFSKTLAPGLRLGWIAAARPIVEQLSLIKQRADLHTQGLSQLLTAELIEGGAFDRHLTALRSEHRRRRDSMIAALRQHVRREDLRFTVPEGGLYLWCRLPDGRRAGEVLERALEDKVAFVAGEPFYCDSGGLNELRICFAGQPSAEAGRAARALGRSLTELDLPGGAG